MKLSKAKLFITITIILNYHIDKKSLFYNEFEIFLIIFLLLVVGKMKGSHKNRKKLVSIFKGGGNQCSEWKFPFFLNYI